MYLKSLELSGFKSFAKKAKLEFKTPITAIVGPNGSGKSNVAEGFRFALGEQRMTQMRTKRTDDLLFSGTPKHPRANRASVKLTFDNKKRLLDIDFDEVVFGRTIHRDSTTDYAINGSTVRLKDVVELLSGAHIGASGHHIISQGETDRILNVNPRDRKAMLEDALGLKVYHYKKDESLRKLERTEANKKEAESLRREIKPHIKFLETQVQKLEKARDMRNELLELYRAYLSSEAKFIEAEEKRLEGERVPLDARRKQVDAKLKNAKETLELLEHKEEASERSRSLEQKLQEAQLDREKLVRELGRVEGAVGAEERRLKRRQERRDALGEVTVSLKKVEELKETIAKEIETAGDTEDTSVLRRVVSRIRSLVESFVLEHSSRDKAEEETGDELQELEREKTSLERQVREAETESQKLQKELLDLRAKVERERESLRGAERSTYELKALKNETEMQLGELSGKEERLKLEKQELEQEKREARALVGEKAFTDGSKSTTALDRAQRESLKKKIERLKIRLEDAGGGSGEDIINEHKEVVERDAFLERELNDLDKSSVSLKQLVSELEDKLAVEFSAGVEKINKELSELFGLMFGGGSARLSLVREQVRKRSNTDIDIDEDIGTVSDMESFDETSHGGTRDRQDQEGVELNVSIPRKRIKGLQMLSGGERALTSIALLFAMSQVNPPPFLVLDETDAALDEANSRRYGDMVERLAKHSQLILITHNRETMSRAGVLYGVTMGADGISQLLSVDFEEAVKVAK